MTTSATVHSGGGSNGTSEDVAAGGTAAARRLFHTYVSEVERFWPGVSIRQAMKLRSRVERLSTREGISEARVIDRVVHMADQRAADRPTPVYITGLGGSGSHWVAEMLNDLDDFVNAGEVYFSPPLIEEMERLSHPEQAWIADAVHLLHAWVEKKDVAGLSTVNTAAGPHHVGRYKRWAPSSYVVYLYREPRDQVMSVVFRKRAFREFEAAGKSDAEYLQEKAERNRNTFNWYAHSSHRADLEIGYEDVKADPAQTLRQIVNAVGLDRSDTAIESAVFHHDAANLRKGLVPAKGNLDEGGRALSWRQFAREWEKRVLHAELIDVVTTLGYEPDDCLGFPLRALPSRPVTDLDFGPGPSLGEVYVGGPKVGPWTHLGAAQGEVTIPADAVVKLRMGKRPLYGLHGVPAETLELIDSLCLAGNSTVSDADLPVLKLMSNLRELDLARTAVTDEGLALVPELPLLQGISVVGTAVRDLTAEGVSRQWPGCEVLGAGTPA